MKTTKMKIRIVPLLLMGFLFPVTQCAELPDSQDDPAGQNELTEEETRGILFMREEEKLARDVYTHLYGIHPLRPFLNISRSEQAHMDAILYLIDTFHLEDPVGTNPAGVFRNEELQHLYHELIAKGEESREEALRVGAFIEEVDIIDLQTELENVAMDENVIRVYTNLCRASENHLRAFVRVLTLYDMDYTPVRLDQDEFERIMGE